MIDKELHPTVIANLRLIQEKAEAMADRIDPERRFTSDDEVTREVLKAYATIARHASRALGYLR